MKIRFGGQLVILILLFFPLLLTYGPLLGNHTVSFAAIQGGDPTRGIDSLPVLDPSAGSHQDEPWTFFIGSAWSHGDIPLINQNNGLGAPLLASLQSGALYPGNLLLIFLPRTSSQFFDLFSVAHVVLLAWGLYTLARRFTDECWIAALVAGSFAASLAVTYHLNMVHFRAFVWGPWIAVALIDLIRSPGRNFPAALLAAFATFCCFSAGNPQEAILDLSAAGLVAIVVLLRDSLWTRWWVIALAGLCCLLIGSATMMPYLTGIQLGDLWSVADPNRSCRTIRPTMLLDMIVPRGTGYAGSVWHTGSGFFELQFAWPATWLLGLIGVFFTIVRKPRSTLWVSVLVAIFVLFICKLAGWGPWDWISQIPILNGIRFTKYTFWTVLVLAPVVTIGITAVQERCREDRTTVTFFSIAILAVFAAAFLGYLVDRAWQPRFDTAAVHLAAAIALASICAATTLPWILGHQWRTPLLLGWTLAVAIAMRPAGFQRELPYEALRQTKPPHELAPASLSDNNWDRGIHRSSPAFFVENPSTLATLTIGDRLHFASGQTRTIQRLSGDQVWLEGSETLDPTVDGYPHPIVIDPLAAKRYEEIAAQLSQPWPRVVDANITPNTNLIIGYVSPWVFDPVMNRRYRNFITREFATFSPSFDTHPSTSYQFSRRQIDVLRMLGVGLILGHPLETNNFYQSLGPTRYQCKQGLMPEACVVPESLVPTLETLFTAGQFGEFTDTILAHCQPCEVARPSANALGIVVPPGPEPRRLIVNRVFMNGWSTSGGSVCSTADFWLSASVPLTGGNVTFHYWPPGLTMGLLLALGGTIGLAFIVAIDRRSSRPGDACPG
jgi:hypothetical protein